MSHGNTLSASLALGHWRLGDRKKWKWTAPEPKSPILWGGGFLPGLSGH